MLSRIHTNRLREIVQKWGGDLVALKYGSEVKNIKTRAPFKHDSIALGVNYSQRIVYYGSWSIDQIEVGDLVHEVGHVFACRKSPSSSDEGTFFGFEYLLSLQIGMTHKQFCSRNLNYWIRNRNYVGDFGSFPDKDQRTILAMNIESGVKYGNIVRGKPRPVR